MNIKKLQSFLFIILIFGTTQLFGQNKWAFDFGLGSSLNTGNVNNCNINNYASIVRNDSLLAFDFHYKFLYSSLINKNNAERKWEESNFEVGGLFLGLLNAHIATIRGTHLEFLVGE